MIMKCIIVKNSSSHIPTWSMDGPIATSYTAHDVSVGNYLSINSYLQEGSITVNKKMIVYCIEIQHIYCNSTLTANILHFHPIYSQPLKETVRHYPQ